MPSVDVDDDISFSSSAFDVVGSWLLGGKSAASSDRSAQDDVRAPSVHRAPVSLYRPSSKTASLSGASATNGKVLTEEEKEMKKKLLRKSGTYRHQQQEDESEAVDTDKLDKEDEELLRARHGERSEPTAKSSDAAADAVGAVAPEAAVPAAVPNTKKRKLTAQEELLEKLREEAARKKAKNLKAKQRMQRKKEEAKKQAAA